ncbi:MAG: (2Fe-2S)-binding protein [Chitinophagaceae bacterium]|nr:MAG: (2Fe-2S)-binding protein [Chitinophagaceae bacterium]
MPDPKHIEWIKIADHVTDIEFASNRIGVVKVKGKQICVGKHNDQVFAFAYKCPHAGGIMADGYIDPLGNVMCPLHRYKFDMKNGRNVTGEGYYLKRWPVEQREDGIFVGMEAAGGFWNLFG